MSVVSGGDGAAAPATRKSGQAPTLYIVRSPSAVTTLA
jgi:hypothetical protein